MVAVVTVPASLARGVSTVFSHGSYDFVSSYPPALLACASVRAESPALPEGGASAPNTVKELS